MVQAPMIPFAILSQARSGTQFLTSLLRAHPDVVAHGEPLNPVHESVDDTTLIECWFRRLPDLRRAAVGVTLLQEQLACRPLTLTRLMAVPGMRFIVLERRDQLARIRSVYQAGLEWKWEVDSPPDHVLPKVTLHTGETLRTLRFGTIWHDQLRTITTVPVAWVTYEELCDDHDDVMASLWAFLGVRSPGIITPTTYRQETRSVEETIDNYEELCATLKGTRYDQGAQ